MLISFCLPSSTPGAIAHQKQKAVNDAALLNTHVSTILSQALAQLTKLSCAAQDGEMVRGGFVNRCVFILDISRSMK